MRFVLGFISAVIFAVVIFLIVIYSGIISVSAADKEGGAIRWILETTMERSVKSEAEKINVPQNFDDPKRMGVGFNHYKEMCQICHAAPGVEKTELAKGLNPKAPEISHAAEEWNEKELFWITKYGIKMTGMPAWGKTHSDDEIWSIVAFIKKMPEMSPEEYESLSAADTLSGDGHQHQH